MLSLIRASLKLKPARAMTRSLNTIAEDDIDAFIESREFIEMSADDFKDLYANDTSGSLRNKVETVLNEYEFVKYNSNGRVPSHITLDDMRFIVEEGDTPYSRERLMNYFFKREMARRSLSKNREKEREETRKRLAMKNEDITKKFGKHDRTGLLTEDGNILYGLWHNSLFPRINEHAERVRFSGNNLSRAALYGRKLIFDFSYDEYMKKQAIKGICEQIQSAYGINRFTFDEPFDIWFCNFKDTNPSYDFMHKNYISNLETTSMITVKDGCPTRYFNKSQLVYLSPNAKKKLTEVQNSDDIYIIGAYNDKGISQPLSMKKAEEMGIRSMSLPLDNYLAWKGPSKNLCVNHVTGILLELIHNDNNWKDALAKHIPQRKVKDLEEIEREESYRSEKLKRFKNRPKFNIFHS